MKKESSMCHKNESGICEALGYFSAIGKNEETTNSVLRTRAVQWEVT